MKKALLICILCLVGCAPTRQFKLGLVDEEVKNSKAIQEAGLKIIGAWPSISGFWRARVGDDIPLSVVKVMDRLDELSEQTEWTKKELGEIAGLRFWLCSEEVRNMLGVYAREVLPYLI